MFISSSNTLTFILAIAFSVSAVPTLSRKDVDFSKSVVEKLNGPPAGWVQDDSIDFDKDASNVKLRIHLVRQGVEKFEEMAMNVSVDVQVLSTSLEFFQLLSSSSPTNLRSSHSYD